MLYFSHEGHLQGVMFFSAIKNKGTKAYTLYFIDLVSFGKKRMICTIAKTLNVFGNLFLPSLSQHVLPFKETNKLKKVDENPFM